MTDNARRAREDSLETVGGMLEHAKIGTLTVHRDRAGNVFLALAADPRAHVILTPDQVGRLHHALACSLWPYGEKPHDLDA